MDSTGVIAKIACHPGVYFFHLVKKKKEPISATAFSKARNAVVSAGRFAADAVIAPARSVAFTA